MKRSLLSLALLLCWAAVPTASCSRHSRLPAVLSDKEYWELIDSLSEPAGAFSLSDNLVSNEPGLAENVRKLSPSGGVYIGVGPEQNFSYIARLRPAMAFIIDIRRENRDLHILYKALFALSSDRAEFVSRLFSRPRPAALKATVSVDEIFTQYATVAPSSDLYSRTAALVRQWTVTTHGRPLSDAELAWIDRAFKAFYDDGPEIRFYGSRDVDAVQPSYRQLMTAGDAFGERRSFLATEEDFRFVKDLHARNLIVPVVGDFGGPTAIRRIGSYVGEHDGAVRAFYGSNVGVYLTNRQTRAFCGHLAALPAAPDARFVERDSVRLLTSKVKDCLQVSGAGPSR